MIRTVVRSVVAMVVITAAFGVVYPLVMTGIAQVAFSDTANGSLVTLNGKTVGSKLAAQNAWWPTASAPAPRPRSAPAGRPPGR